MKKITPLLACLLLTAGTLLAQWSQITNIPVPISFQYSPSYMDIDGTNLYVSANNEGLFKGNGTSWSQISSDLSVSLVQASGNTVCAFSYLNYGFYYSTDGGATFQQGGPGFFYVSGMLVQGNKVFVLDDSGFYISEDQGQTFTNTGLIPSGYYAGQIVQTPDGKIMVVSSWDPNTFQFLGSQVFRSTDDVNWTEISGSGGSNPLPTLQSSGRETYFVTAGYLNGAILAGSYNYDGLGALYKTTDLGANWYPVNNGLFAYNGYIAAFGSSRIYAVDDSYSTKTSTDGTNWIASNAPGSVLAGEGTKFAATSDGKIYLSTDNGITWPPAPGQGNDIVRDYLALNANTHFVVTTHNGIFKGTGANPANLTWTKVLGTGVNNGGDYGWDIFRKGSVLLAGIDFVVGGNQGIYRSTNLGSTWTKTHDGTGLCFFDDGSAVYAGVDYEGIFKSYNSGQTWTAANNGIPSDDLFRSPSAFVKAGNNLIASFYIGGIYLSSNQGASWSQVFDNNFLTIYCLAKAGSTLFAGTQTGLLKSTDNGLTWSFVQNDLYNATAVTALYVKSANELYIGTGNMGMFVTTDGGETLEPLNDGVGDNVFVSCITREGGKLFAGWNQNPGYYYYYPSFFGHMLWQYNGNNNNNKPGATDREAIASEPRLAIYPNPVQDVLQFSLNVAPEQVVHLQIINAKGETVRQEQGPIDRPVLQVQELANGAYFLKITLQDGTNLTQRFMVMRGR